MLIVICTIFFDKWLPIMDKVPFQKLSSQVNSNGRAIFNFAFSFNGCYSLICLFISGNEVYIMVMEL